MQSKATRRSANAVVKVRRLLIEIFRAQSGPADGTKYPPWFTIIVVIFGWVVFAGVVGLAWLAIGLL